MKPYTAEDAETELRTAIDSGDRERIDAAAAAVDRLEQPAAPVPLLSAALWYAEQGLRVFAVRPGIKHPFASCAECKTAPKCPGPEACGHDQCHGLLDATTDPARLRHWWTAQPQANIGIATGHLVDVVDVDGPDGQQSRATHWEKIFSRIDADSIAKVLTPRAGGMHIYVPATGVGNSTEIVDAVDYRGAGGYALAPPSVIAPGGKDAPGRYRFLGTPNLAALSPAKAG